MLHTDFCHSLTLLLAHNWRQGIETTVFYNMSTMLPQQRQQLVVSAQQWAATHILWLDSDMRFPPDTAQRLLAHGYPIVAANYVTRSPPFLTVAYRSVDDRMGASTGSALEPVVAIGMGCMLTRVDVFSAVPKPWFEFSFNPDHDTYLGEDFNFCFKAAQMNFDIWVDHGLSQDLAHIGSFAHTQDLLKS
jgi:hypothetical protein